jgi:quercetin dioxygenase-like cupin family protein
MNGSRMLAQALAVVAFALVPSVSQVFAETAAQPAAAMTTVIERREQAAQAPQGADLYQSVLDFEPGAWTLTHSHNGQSYNTVLEGEVVLRIDGVDQTFKAGEGWVDQPDVIHLVGNQTNEPAKMVASFVVQHGVQPSVIQVPDDVDEDSLPPQPDVIAATKTLAPSLPQPMDVVQQVIEIQPGSSVPLQTTAGTTLVSVIEGTVAIGVDGKTYEREAGKSLIETEGQAASYTTTDTMARLIVTSFVPRDASALVPASPSSAVTAATNDDF